MSERRVLTAMHWNVPQGFDEECLKAYRPSKGQAVLDRDYCAVCEEFPTCQKREARYIRMLAEAFRSVPRKSLPEIEIKRRVAAVMKRLADETKLENLQPKEEV